MPKPTMYEIPYENIINLEDKDEDCRFDINFVLNKLLTRMSVDREKYIKSKKGEFINHDLNSRIIENIKDSSLTKLFSFDGFDVEEKEIEKKLSVNDKKTIQNNLFSDNKKVSFAEILDYIYPKISEKTITGIKGYIQYRENLELERLQKEVDERLNSSIKNKQYCFLSASNLLDKIISIKLKKLEDSNRFTVQNILSDFQIKFNCILNIQRLEVIEKNQRLEKLEEQVEELIKLKISNQ